MVGELKTEKKEAKQLIGGLFVVQNKMLACECLNVIIEAETVGGRKVGPGELQLTEDEMRDAFFRQVCRIFREKFFFVFYKPKQSNNKRIESRCFVLVFDVSHVNFNKVNQKSAGN